jgi:glycosyltransferase involved in cell wall biosynthesis
MKVSVLINNYNYGRFLDECLKSIESQTIMPFEVILYDDGSSDNSLSIARNYDFVDIISSKNYGEKPCFNQANAIYKSFLASKGDIICLLDSDDFFAKNKIEKVIESFMQNKHSVLVQNSYFEWKNNNIAQVLNYGISNVDYLRLYKNRNWSGFFNPTSCLSFKREYLEKVLPIENDGKWKVWSDVRLSRIAPYYGSIVSLPDVLTYYRKHGQSDSDTMNSANDKILANQIEHHNYLNIKISELGGDTIKFRRSFMFFKFYVKKRFSNLLNKYYFNE